MSTTANPGVCWKCGREIGGTAIIYDSRRFHPECSPLAPAPSSPSPDLIEGVLELFPGADRQALQCLANLLAKQQSDSAAELSRLRAEMDEARANSKRLHDALLTLKSKIGPRSALARFINAALGGQHGQ